MTSQSFWLVIYWGYDANLVVEVDFDFVDGVGVSIDVIVLIITAPPEAEEMLLAELGVDVEHEGDEVENADVFADFTLRLFAYVGPGVVIRLSMMYQGQYQAMKPDDCNDLPF